MSDLFEWAAMAAGMTCGACGHLARPAINPHVRYCGKLLTWRRDDLLVADCRHHTALQSTHKAA